jgi:hypothetical protein
MDHAPDPLQLELGPRLDGELAAKVDEIFRGESLVQLILHAHLLIERALMHEIKRLLPNPAALDRAHNKWDYAHKAALFCSLARPARMTEDAIWGFSKLKNAIAHDLGVDPIAAVAKHLPWQLEAPPPADVRARVQMEAVLVLGDLGGAATIRQIAL